MASTSVCSFLCLFVFLGPCYEIAFHKYTESSKFSLIKLTWLATKVEELLPMFLNIC